MRPSLAAIVERKKSDLFGAYSTNKPEEIHAIVGLIDGLLCCLRVWEKPRDRLSGWELDALRFLNSEIKQADLANPIGLTVSLYEYIEKNDF